MAIDETELSNAAGGQGHDAPVANAPTRFAEEDFRLRLDSPLFHRDPGMVVASVPQLRELTWEHVVRPSQQVPVITARNVGQNEIESGHVAPDSAPAPSIESLLHHVRDSDEGGAAAEEGGAVEPHAVALYSLDVDLDDVDLDDVDLDDVDLDDVDLDDVDLDDVDLDVVPVVATLSPHAQSLLESLAQMDEVPVDPPVSYLTADADDAQLPGVGAGGVHEVPREPISERLPIVVVASTQVSVTPSDSAVEAELNRLAFLPDHPDEPGPVEVPPIAHSELRRDEPMPALSQHEIYVARNAVPVSHSRLNLVDVSTTFVPVTRKKKRNGFVRFATFLVFVALLAGAAYAGKYYFLDKRWEGDVKALAGEVEVARGLTFDHPVTVTELPMSDYAQKLATAPFGMDTAALEQQAGAWRAVGILSGVLNLNAIGMAAVPDSPAFYDPTTETIFTAQGVADELHTFAMHRALTMALLDQQFSWAERAAAGSPSVQHGVKTYYDADALAVAVGLTTPTDRTAIVSQIFGLYGEYSIAASPAPFASTLAGRLGVALRPYFESGSAADRAEQEKVAAPTDGQALDLRRLTSNTVETTSVTSQGMLFWYHALAGRIDQDTAWQAALAWQDDDLSIVGSATSACVVAHLRVDPASVDAVTAALQAWAAAAPPTSATAVSLTPDSPMQLQINACDPGVDVPTTSGAGYLALGGAPLRAEQFKLLLIAQPTLPAAQAACAVFAGDTISIADERGVIDNPEGWTAPANHPLPDPSRLGCAPA